MRQVIKTDTVSVLADAEAGDMTRRKEEEKGAKIATVAVLRLRNGRSEKRLRPSKSEIF
jgi:hypothetical protein